METENTLREYTETRMKMYLDMVKTKCRKEDEEKLFDNIMELISCMDYCFVGLNVTGLQMLDEIKTKHKIIHECNLTEY